MPDSDRPLRIGVVGVGLLGERHTRFWAQQADIELVGVADSRVDRAREVAGKWGAAVAAASVSDLIEQAHPDAVSVATPDFLHREPVIAALRAGVHVLCEKPLAMTTDDAAAMIQAARAAGRILMVNHSMRWIPHYAALKRQVESGELGQVVSAHSFKADTLHVPTTMLAWSRQTTPAYFLTAHDLDLVRWFVDDEVEEVFAQSASQVLRARGIDTPDVVQASVRFRGGCVASFEASWILPDTYPSLTDNYMHVFGSKKAVYLNRGAEALEVYDEQRVSYPKLSTVYEHGGRIYGSFRHALEHFADCVRTGAEPLTSAQNVYGVVAGLEAIHRSIETRRPERAAPLAQPQVAS
ncbi:MAG: Gfo/Idh/MocA family oxidoreductase [Chloroflexota bacterium]